jgi:hypothetical protein
MKNRDKKGRFVASGEPNPFNRKWVRRDSVQPVAAKDADAERELYILAFKTARRLAITFDANSCYEAYLKYGK